MARRGGRRLPVDGSATGWLLAEALPAQHDADTVLGPGWAAGQTTPAAPPARLVTQHRPDGPLVEPVVV